MKLISGVLPYLKLQLRLSCYFADEKEQSFVFNVCGLSISDILVKGEKINKQQY